MTDRKGVILHKIDQVDHKLQFERSFVIFELVYQKLWYLQNFE